MRVALVLLALIFSVAVVSAEGDECPTGFEMVEGECRFSAPVEKEQSKLVTKKKVSDETSTVVAGDDIRIITRKVEYVTTLPYRDIGQSWEFGGAIDEYCKRLWSVGIDPRYVVIKNTRFLLYEQPMANSIGIRFQAMPVCSDDPSLKPEPEPTPEPVIDFVGHLIAIYDAIIELMTLFPFIEGEMVDQLVSERDQLLTMVK